jgi:hypothetical protein
MCDPVGQIDLDGPMPRTSPYQIVLSQQEARVLTQRAAA